MIDILFVTYNRLEFTKASLSALIANTDWSKVRHLILCDDGSKDGTREYLDTVQYPVQPKVIHSHVVGPVGITNFYLRANPSEIFAKIDNDTMVPPYWLTECLNVMDKFPALDLLGIEAFCSVLGGQAARDYKKATHIGGIGLMRKRCFKTLPVANGRHGFTQWQQKNVGVVKGWIQPSLPVFLLDKFPAEPWLTYSKNYVAKGLQRKWPLYVPEQKTLWEWWQGETGSN